MTRPFSHHLTNVEERKKKQTSKIAQTDFYFILLIIIKLN